MATQQNDKLLKEIKQRFDYCVDQWRDIREQGKLDMRFISGDPWEPEERKARKAAGRPCLSLDELNQYVNQLINDVRQNKRAIKVIPTGNGANDDSAEFRGNHIRQIEYKSNAQSAYIGAFEDATRRSYGAFRIGKRYISESSFDQELVIRRIPNPDTVYLDPDCKEADCSDMKYGFVLERFTHEEFKRRWPKATVKSFSSELIHAAPRWITEQDLQVAEYWKVKTTPRTLLLLSDNRLIFKDELETEEGRGYHVEIILQRESERREIIQYITNGVEILETNKWDGKYIPLVPVFGKEMYVDDGSGSKRVLMSLIRLARDPYMLYCYYRTCQAEIIGQVPKVPWVGAEGQFEGHEDEWANAHKVPVGFLQYKATLDSTGQAMLPPPRRDIWEPPIQALDLGAEGARRAIQAALGMYNASVGKKDSAGKSGVAIKALDDQSSQGNFHHIDNYDRALEHAGRILDDLLPKVYDTPREVATRKADDSYSVVKINEPFTDDDGKEQEYRTDRGEHEVTITTGPSFQSQREEVDEFVTRLAGVPEIMSRIGDLLVKLKNLGPIGDQIAERLKPPDLQNKDGQPDPQQVQALVQQHQQLVERINELTDTLNTKRLELESKERIEDKKLWLELVKVLAEFDGKTAALESQEALELLKQQLGVLSEQFKARAAESKQPAPGV